MPKYSRMNVNELREELRKRDLPYENLNKPAMIEALWEHDSDNVQDNEHAVESADVVDNDEVIIDSAVDNVEGNVATESEQITALKLQLEIARINLQLAQTGKETAIDRPDGIVNAIDLAHLKSRLPVMSPNCDILAFFANFERALELNGVPKEFWSR